MRPTWLSTSRHSVSTGSRPSPPASVRAGSRGSPPAHPTRCTTGPAFPSESPPDRLHLLSAAPRAATKVVGGARAGRSVRFAAVAPSPVPPGRGNEKEPPRGAALDKDRRRPTLPGGCPPSTIGAERLNGSVRNGKRCFPLAISPPKRVGTAPVELENRIRPDRRKKIRQALDPLVPVC
jgi:hypothetical protein